MNVIENPRCPACGGISIWIGDWPIRKRFAVVEIETTDQGKNRLAADHFLQAYLAICQGCGAMQLYSLAFSARDDVPVP